MDSAQFREVSAWLASLYGSAAAVPPYEVNAETVAALYALSRRSRDAAAVAAAVEEATLLAADEYDAQRALTNAMLEDCGVAPSALSKAGAGSLATLADLAVTLDVVDASEPSLLLGLADLADESDSVAAALVAETEVLNEVQFQTEAAREEIGRYRVLREAYEESAADGAAEVETRARNTVYLEKKRQEYRRTLAKLSSALEAAGLRPELRHDALTAQASDLADLKDALAPKVALLQTYNDLPADLTLAKLKMEEASRELAALEAQIAKLIHGIHMR